MGLARAIAIRLRRHGWPLRAIAVVVAALAIVPGCGTTRWTDSQRTATEQLVLSDAIDRAINQLDCRALAGKEVYFDSQHLKGIVDEQYVSSALRQHLLANGCVLRDDRQLAKYIVEARAGAVGTNRHDLLFGVPQTQLPTFSALPAMPATIPEIPLAKRTKQQGVAKIALFAYNRESGRPLWQSGSEPIASTAQSTWVFGVGPVESGSIYDGTKFAGGKLAVPFVGREETPIGEHPHIPITGEAYFGEPAKTAAPTTPPAPSAAPATIQASHSVPAAPALVAPPKSIDIAPRAAPVSPQPAAAAPSSTTTRAARIPRP